jgi:hypothetical protein
MGEARGLQLFRDIVATNGISVRKGHSLLTNLVAAGEVPLALTAYGFLAEQAKRKGAPLDWFVIPPAIARSTAEGLARNAPHPYAAVLFYDFLTVTGRRSPASRALPASRNVEPPFRLPFPAHRLRRDARSRAEVAGAVPEDDHHAVAVDCRLGRALLRETQHLRGGAEGLGLAKSSTQPTCHLISAFCCSGPGRRISFCTRQFRISAT